LKNKKKYGALISALVAIIIISPLDDIAIAALFGTAFFGFGSIPFYLLMAGTSTASITVWLWRKHAKNNVTKGFSQESLTKTNLTPSKQSKL
jgi:hypothetical protein